MKNVLLFACTAAAITGCTGNFLDYNTNPNETTKREVGSIFLLAIQNVRPVQQEGIGSDRYQTVENMVGDNYAGYCGFPAPNINSAGRYNWSSSSWYGDMFMTGYLRGMSAWRDLRDAYADNLDSPQFSLAQIVKVATMHRVADTYGPIPYLDFGLQSVVAYNSQQEVYHRFFEELDAAIDNLEPYASAGEKIFTEWDVVYNGDIKSWVKFANTLRLRLAMRISFIDPVKAQAEAEAAVGNSIGVMTAKSDLAELKHISPIANYESPLYIISGWDDVCMGATIDSYMNGYQDPRRDKYFLAATGGGYTGIRAGMSGTLSKSLYTAGNFSKLNVNSETNVVWMRASEAYFLRAEGALNGWNMGGDAKDLYEAGISLSFDEHDKSGASSYITNSTLTPANYTDPVTSSYSTTARGTITIAWEAGSGSAVDERNLERIITQKYLALYPIGQEAWSEFRRTGYPKVFPVCVNESNGGTVNTTIQIRRLPYPTDEYNTNRELLNDGIVLLGGPDNPGTRLWWDTGR